MRRLLVLLAVLLLLPGTVQADGAWRGKRVVVNDYTSPAYKPAVADMVRAFNTMLPKHAPRLVYRPQPERPCSALDRAKQRGTIAVCLSGGSWDLTNSNVKRGELQWAMIILIGDDSPAERPNTICHEMMHAVTDVPDNYLDPHAATSCVQGTLPYPGSWDAAYARKVYKQARHR